LFGDGGMRSRNWKHNTVHEDFGFLSAEFGFPRPCNFPSSRARLSHDSGDACAGGWVGAVSDAVTPSHAVVSTINLPFLSWHLQPRRISITHNPLSPQRRPGIIKSACSFKLTGETIAGSASTAPGYCGSRVGERDIRTASTPATRNSAGRFCAHLPSSDASRSHPPVSPRAAL